MIFTIGHSNHAIEKFLKLLQTNNINCICDVRSIPYSRFAEQYNRENIKEILNKNNIQYLFWGDELGARREEESLLTDGVVDFDKVALNVKFLTGIKRIQTGIEKGYRIALMCTEKEPLECHRTILISKKLAEIGIKVVHILPNGILTDHKQIEKDLVEKYFPDKNQISVFELYESLDFLKEAYRKANFGIGY